ncbi:MULTISPECIES: DUF465 domain-containing protein [Calditerrivibrio]|uniref:DUF465 domain-containing protein n=1 Tax=Calditerrivibrio nitroreducens TaxID=477976 RepID=A0A2J6WMR1_9BACT|nr:MAG: DUF465 domain-containing protein [Calditerrivibrio nitroreducens]
MIKYESELIQELYSNNEEFKMLYDEHIQLEQDLEALCSLKYFPPEVQVKIKEIKVRKLQGKDRMEQIIANYKDKRGN